MKHPMENTQVHRLWQVPFAERKLAPIVRRLDLSRVKEQETR
jgi:hypothetical protein